MSNRGLVDSRGHNLMRNTSSGLRLRVMCADAGFHADKTRRPVAKRAGSPSLRAALGLNASRSRCVSWDHDGAHPKRRANSTQAAPVLFPEGDLGFYVPSAP
jgi:hypothetical protein